MPLKRSEVVMVGKGIEKVVYQYLKENPEEVFLAKEVSEILRMLLINIP